MLKKIKRAEYEPLSDDVDPELKMIVEALLTKD